jgi:hypothetical protein
LAISRLRVGPSRRCDSGRGGKTDGRAFLPNEPILDFSKKSFKCLIINNLTAEVGVVKKRQLKNEPILGTPPKCSKRGQKNGVRKMKMAD